MERLTERWGEDDVWVKDHDYVTAAYRLAAYEDTGLTPEECARATEIDDILLDEYYPIGRMRELIKADKDGRVEVLPCKVGDTVYWVHGAVITECKVYRVQKNRKGLYICLKSNVSHGAFRVDLSIGKTVFLTREEAEKALEAKRDVCP
jgi:hypothetical protein